MTNETLAPPMLQDQLAQFETSGFDPLADLASSRRLVWDLQPNVLKISYARRKVEGVWLVQALLFLVGTFFVGVGVHMLYVVWTQPWGPGPEHALKESITPAGLSLVMLFLCVWAISQGLNRYELCVGPYAMMFRRHGLFGTREIASLPLNAIQNVVVKKSLFRNTQHVPQPGEYWGLEVTAQKRIERFGVGLREQEVRWIQQTVLFFLVGILAEPGEDAMSS